MDTIPEQHSVLDKAPRIPARGGSTKIRRFDGLSRRTADWDGLRKDSQLWSRDGNCFVHFYAYGTSQRGASLRVPYESIQKLQSSYLAKYCLRHRSVASDGSNDGVLETEYDLHVPVPLTLSRDEAFAYHLTTRNVVAYALGRPVVGERLSTALVEVWRRLRDWTQDGVSRINFTAYLRQQGYLSFVENAEHALACLKFAEETRFRDVWIDAFAHCAGMHERLDLSPEFAGVSKTTAALLTRASLEMDLHIGRVTKALGGFLEEELGPEYLGLSKQARDHLDHFRSFLSAYYVDKLGWFPPPQQHFWDKRPWRDMYHDFQSLYDYLVDRESSQDWTSNRGTTGGVCVIQNVQAFDARHGYEPLQHPLALLPPPPNVKRRRSIVSQTGLKSLKLGRTSAVPEPIVTPYQALTIATNPAKFGVVQRHMVQEYQRFERQKLDAKLDFVEARKVRWLLIYSVLQMLISIIKGPPEVHDAAAASYPVCVLTTGCPAFGEDDDVAPRSSTTTVSATKAVLVPDALEALEGRSVSRISIHPDCEADCADDFFAATAISRRDSELSLSQLMLQRRPSMPLSRNNSFRTSMHSSVQAFHKSLVGSLNRRNSRRASLPAEVTSQPRYCEIVVADYGNGVTKARQREDSSRPPTAVRVVDGATIEAASSLGAFDFGFGTAMNETPQHHSQLEIRTSDLDYEADVDQSPSDSPSSATTVDMLDSNRSSYMNEDDTSDTDLSSYDGDMKRHDSTLSKAEELSKEHITYRPRNPQLGVSAACWSVNAGCYTPTGLILPPKSKFAEKERPTSSRSTTSSVYPDDSIQAADIEEDDTRGRQRSRALDGFTWSGRAFTGEGVLRAY